MKILFIVSVLLAAGLITGGRILTVVAVGGASQPSGSEQPAADITAIAQPLDLLNLTPTYPNYPGVTPAPAKNGPFGLAKAMPVGQMDSATAPSVMWFDTQEQLQAAVKSLAPNNIIVGVLYENAPPSGRVLTIYSASCSSGLSNLGGSFNFDNITSSLDNNCGTATLYFDPNYGGPQQSYPNGTTSNVGPGMNDQASSVHFAP